MTRSVRREPGKSDMTGSAITIEGLSHRFGPSVLAIDNISVDIREGEFISIVGPSGCGKTTLLNIIAGLHPVQEGTASVLGAPPALGSRNTAYMMARDGLLPWLTASKNAEFGASIRGMPTKQREARARHLLESVGLGQFINAHPKELSHGMRQRVALARTFCLESPLLLMDEPFGALDAQTKLQLEEVLLDLWSEERRTVLFITHDLSEAIALSDRVLVMSRRPGRIIADIPITLPRPRSIRSLQKDPVFHELYAGIWGKLEVALHDH